MKRLLSAVCGTVAALSLAACGTNASTIANPSADEDDGIVTGRQLKIQENLRAHWGVEAVNPEFLDPSEDRELSLTTTPTRILPNGKPIDCSIAVTGATTVVDVTCGGEKIGTLSERNKQATAAVLTRLWKLRPVNVDALPDKPWTSNNDITLITRDNQVVSCRVGVLADFTSLRVVCKNSPQRVYQPERR